LEQREDIFKESFNEDFCSFLEYHLTATFQNSNDRNISSLWCDGILPSLIIKQISKKSVNDARKIITKAFIGKDGQTEFEMTIFFGKYSLRRYSKGTSLEDCVPENDSMDWVNIDLEKRTIELQLK